MESRYFYFFIPLLNSKFRTNLLYYVYFVFSLQKVSIYHNKLQRKAIFYVLGVPNLTLLCRIIISRESYMYIQTVKVLLYYLFRMVSFSSF